MQNIEENVILNTLSQKKKNCSDIYRFDNNHQINKNSACY